MLYKYKMFYIKHILHLVLHSKKNTSVKRILSSSDGHAEAHMKESWDTRKNEGIQTETNTTAIE